MPSFARLRHNGSPVANVSHVKGLACSLLTLDIDMTVRISRRDRHTGTKTGALDSVANIHHLLTFRILYPPLKTLEKDRVYMYGTAIGQYNTNVPSDIISYESTQKVARRPFAPLAYNPLVMTMTSNLSLTSS